MSTSPPHLPSHPTSAFTHLPPHLPLITTSTLFFFLIDHLSLRFGHWFFPVEVARLGEREKRVWRSRAVALIHAILCIPLCLYTYDTPSLRSNKVFGYDEGLGRVIAFSYGFIWDVYDAIFYQSAGFIVHGLACLAIFAFSFRPFLQYYGPTFLLWELSTPMLNLRWYFEKLGWDKKYPTLNLINDLAFVFAFFLARIVFGTMNSVTFFKSIVEERANIPLWLFCTYGAGNIALNCLNWLWFSKIARRMLATLQNKPRPVKHVHTAMSKKDGDGNANFAANGGGDDGDDQVVDEPDVTDEPLVEVIDQYNQYENEVVVLGENPAAASTIAVPAQSRAPEHSPSDPNSPRSIITSQQAFFIALAFRSTSLFSQTFFQPDEFYQAHEPAHRLVFGTGFLTWEWRDLPSVPGATLEAILEQGGWRSKLVLLLGEKAAAGGGHLRSWLWPGVFAVVYKALELAGLDETGLTRLVPRLPCVLLAALTDVYTFKLAHRLLPGRGEAALFLSLTNLFHAHALPRALTTSAETCLTIIALFFWPFASATRTIKDNTVQPRIPFGDLAWSLSLSAIAFILRPTNVIFWAILGLELVWRQGRRNPMDAAKVAGLAMLIGCFIALSSASLDYILTGSWNIPGLSFFAYNILFDISRFYGTSPWHYHLFQSLPILLTTSLPFVLPTFVKALAASSLSRSETDTRQKEATLRTQDYNVGLLAKAAFGTIVAFSVIPHKEWRFLHPLLPVLLIFGAHTLVAAYKVNPSGGLLGSKLKTMCAGFRIERRAFLFLLLTPVIPWLYLSFIHGRAQVEVTEWLGEQARLDPELEAMFLMPCHATPWMSHMHVKNRVQADGWRFLTCEPPIGETKTLEARAFYADPHGHFDSVPTSTTHLVLFGDLFARLQSTEDPTPIGTLLSQKGWTKVWKSSWNGLDILQDEEERRGGIMVFRRKR